MRLLGAWLGLLTLCFAVPAAAQTPTVDDLYNLGWVAIQEERYDEAIAYYKQVVERSPTYKEAWYNLGHAHSFKKNYDEEIAAYEKAIELDPDYNKALTSISYAYGDKRDHAQVIEYGVRAIALDQASYDGFFYVGHAYYNLAREQATLDERDAMLHKAYAAYVIHIVRHPEDSSCWYNLGLNADLLGDDAKAVGAYRKALQFRPEYPKAQYNLGLSLDKLGDTAGALEAWNRYLEVAGALPEEADYLPYARGRVEALGGAAP